MSLLSPGVQKCYEEETFPIFICWMKELLFSMQSDIKGIGVPADASRHLGRIWGFFLSSVQDCTVFGFHRPSVPWSGDEQLI